MSGYRRVNYYELCRLCTSSEGNKMNIFRDEGRKRQLQNKIQICLPVQVLEEDSLPKIVCHECVKKLENFFEFRETVVSAEGMLESYFTSLRFSEDFLKEGKVYVKTEEKKRSPTPEDDQVKLEKTSSPPNTQIAVTEQPVQHQQPVVVSNVNASNIHIISGVQARVQQYKCAMQMQPGGVAAAVVEATAETHYSYQQQTSQQVPQQQQSNQSQGQINQQSNQVHQTQNQQIQQTQNQIQNQNQNQMNQQAAAQAQINQQTQRQINQQNQSQIVQQNPTQISQQQNQTQIVQQQQQQQQQQNQSQITQQIQQLQRQQREFEKQQRHLQQIEKQQVQIVQQQEQQQTQIGQSQHQNNNIILKNEASTEQNQQVIQKVQSESQDNDTSNQNVQTYTTVQATPEILLSLGFKEAALAAQVARDDSKDFKDFIKVTPDDAISRNSIGQISEFLRIRTVPEPSSLITVNPQAVSQSSRIPSCRDCGKSFTTLNQLNNHNCSSSSLLNNVADMKEDNTQTNGSPFSCDVCGKPFKRKEHLFQHRKLHTGERPFTCPACGKAFSRKEHLVRHSVSHTGQKMHECEMCGKSFSRKDNLHKHRKTHGVSGPYICDTCGKSFVVKHYYLMHLTTHAPTIDGLGCQDPLPYKCDQCHKAFSVKQYLTTHKLRHRSKNNANAHNSSNTSVQQQSNSSTNNVSSSASLNNGNGQTSNTSVVEIQSVIEGNEQNGQFNGNQYHGNLQHFQ